mgnify:CR=1 FL=1
MRNLSILLLAVALAACNSGKKDQGAGKAEGQILPASVSDAMLPLDTVRSQAPLAPKAEGAVKGETGAEDSATEAAAEPAASGAPAPAETPAG